jgi:hypothetical protein
LCGEAEADEPGEGGGELFASLSYHNLLCFWVITSGLLLFGLFEWSFSPNPAVKG